MYHYVISINNSESVLNIIGLDPNILQTSYLVLAGGSICMPCYSGNENSQPGARFEWSRGEISLQQTERLRVASDGALCINNAKFSDADNYTCYMSGEPYPSLLSVIGKYVKKFLTFSVYLPHFPTRWNHCRASNLWLH